MAEKIVNTENIRATVETLTKEGLKPTIRNIRDRIGGSHTTISLALKDLATQRFTAMSTFRIPDGLNAALMETLESVTTTATSAAKIRIEELEDQIRQLASANDLFSETKRNSELMAEIQRLAPIEKACARIERELIESRAKESAEIARAKEIESRWTKADSELTEMRQKLTELMHKIGTLEGERALVTEFKTVLEAGSIRENRDGYTGLERRAKK